MFACVPVVAVGEVDRLDRRWARRPTCGWVVESAAAAGDQNSRGYGTRIAAMRRRSKTSVQRRAMAWAGW